MGQEINEAFEVADNATSLPRPSTSRLQTVKTAHPDRGGRGQVLLRADSLMTSTYSNEWECGNPIGISVFRSVAMRL